MDQYLSSLTEEQWKERLDPEEYRVLREGGTEPAFTGEYVDNHEDGTYFCKACGAELFSSQNKFDSGTGWPSFDQPAEEDGVEIRSDTSGGMVREEVVCANCGSHLGHRFPDGPSQTTGQRYCMNSVCLAFREK
jgi:peptide-methionine (R)-S-oxide reductase